MVKTEKYCNGCQTVLPIEMFSPSKRDGYYSRCRPCTNAYIKTRYALYIKDPAFREKRNKQARESKNRNPRSYMKRRGEWLKYKYNMTLEDYDVLLKSQNGVCAICLQPCKTKKGLAVDHDHSCCPGDKSCGKCIRGLLCSNCNGAIGMLQEDPVIINRVIEYLS